MIKLLDKLSHSAICDKECEIWDNNKLIMVGRFLYLPDRNSLSICYDVGLKEKTISKAVIMINGWSEQFVEDMFKDAGWLLKCLGKK